MRPRAYETAVQLSCDAGQCSSNAAHQLIAVGPVNIYWWPGCDHHGAGSKWHRGGGVWRRDDAEGTVPARPDRPCDKAGRAVRGKEGSSMRTTLRLRAPFPSRCFQILSNRFGGPVPSPSLHQTYLSKSEPRRESEWWGRRRTH